MKQTKEVETYYELQVEKEENKKNFWLNLLLLLTVCLLGAAVISFLHFQQKPEVHNEVSVGSTDREIVLTEGGSTCLEKGLDVVPLEECYHTILLQAIDQYPEENLEIGDTVSRSDANICFCDTNLGTCNQNPDGNNNHPKNEDIREICYAVPCEDRYENGMCDRVLADGLCPRFPRNCRKTCGHCTDEDTNVNSADEEASSVDEEEEECSNDLGLGMCMYSSSCPSNSICSSSFYCTCNDGFCADAGECVGSSAQEEECSNDLELGRCFWSSSCPSNSRCSWSMGCTCNDGFCADEGECVAN